MSKIIDLSIITISYNTKQLLDDCLCSIYQSLKDSPFVFEIIVIDNNSSDGSVVYLKKKYPNIRIIANAQNVGYGKANNQGVAAAFGKTILLLNSDVVVLNKAIIKLYSYFISLPSKSIAGGKLFNPDQTPQPSCGPGYTLFTIFIALFLKGDYIDITRYSPNTIKQVDWVMGACLMTGKSAFAEIGWFDEQIFMYMDEIDLQYRAQKLGYKIYFYPKAHFIHLGAGSSQGRATPILNVFRGFIFYYKKHYSYVQLIALRILLLFKSSLAIVLFTLLRKKSDQNLYFQALKIALS